MMLRGLTWAVLRAWTQNHPPVVGTCPGRHPRPIAQNRVFKIDMPGPPTLIPLKIINFPRSRLEMPHSFLIHTN